MSDRWTSESRAILGMKLNWSNTSSELEYVDSMSFIWMLQCNHPFTVCILRIEKKFAGIGSPKMITYPNIGFLNLKKDHVKALWGAYVIV